MNPLPYYPGMADSSSAVAQTAGWQAELQLGFSVTDGRSRLTRRHHLGPLVVQRPFYPEGDVCHVYLVHPPGGIVGGDQLRLEVAADPGSHVLLTTPAATKFYRAAPQLRARLSQHLSLTGATLEWLPQENIFFRSADARVSTRVDLDAKSRFIGCELACYGRPAGDELFTRGRLRQSFELYCDGEPLLLDQLRLDGAEAPMHAAWGLGGHCALGTLLAYPAATADVEAVRGLAGAAAGLSCSLVDRVLVCRVIGSSGEQSRNLLLAAWRCLRPRLLGREPVSPRIWAT